MKYKEFKNKIKNIGFNNDINLKVTENELLIHIENNSTFCGAVAKKVPYLMDTTYVNFQDLDEYLKRDLLKTMYELAITPIPERQEEKRYIVPLPHLITSNGEQQYLSNKGGTWFASRKDENLRQTWKEEHLSYIPEEYRKYAVEGKDEI